MNLQNYDKKLFQNYEMKLLQFSKYYSPLTGGFKTSPYELPTNSANNLVGWQCSLLPSYEVVGGRFTINGRV